jgi:cytidyltransferase-like protein
LGFRDYCIFNSVEELRTQVDILNEDLIVTSGGFDPMHIGHLRCIQESAEIVKSRGYVRGRRSKLAVIVNGDGFLVRKKGAPFMKQEERIEIIAGIAGVDYVVPWDDGSQTVVGAISVLKPVIFTKGGDRDSASNVPEFDLCNEIGCEVVFNVGGGKIQSSSWLIESASNAKSKN